jgi:pyridoxine 4-dehydrogenase
MAAAESIMSKTFSIGGDLTVNRLGFGAMRITGAASGLASRSRERKESIAARDRVSCRLPKRGLFFVPVIQRERFRIERAPMTSQSGALAGRS